MHRVYPIAGRTEQPLSGGAAVDNFIRGADDCPYFLVELKKWHELGRATRGRMLQVDR
jgi:hypothetical protein